MRRGMQVCPACGEENPERARFCNACGGRRSPTKPPRREERKVVSVALRRPRRLHRRARERARSRGRPRRPAPRTTSACRREHRALRRHGREVHRRRGDGGVRRAGRARGRRRARGARAALRILETIEELTRRGTRRCAVRVGGHDRRGASSRSALGPSAGRGSSPATSSTPPRASRLRRRSDGILVDEPTMRRPRSAPSSYEALERDRREGKGAADRRSGARCTPARRVGEPEAATQTTVRRTRARADAAVRDVPARGSASRPSSSSPSSASLGIGKSRLVTELRSAPRRPARGRDVAAWTLPAVRGRNHVLGARRDREVGGRDPRVGRSGRGCRRSSTRRSSASSTRRASVRWFGSRLGPLVGAEGDGSAVAREEVFTAWRRFLEAVAAKRPCVPRRRGSPLGGWSTPRVPRAPPRLELARPAAPYLHGAS